MNKPVPAHNIGGYVPMIDGPEKVSGRAKYTADILAPGQLAGRIYRSPYSHGEIVDVDIVGSAEAARRARHRHRRRLRQGLRRAADRTHGISAGARQGALSRRAGGRRGGNRRRHRARGVAPHQAHGARASGLLHIEGALAPDADTTARQEARQYRARRAVRTGLNRARLCRGRSGARRHLQLRRSLPEPDGDACGGRRIRRVARPHDGARLDAGALLRAPDAGADPRHGDVAHPRDQAACRRRLRLPHRDAGRRIDRGAAGAQGQRHGAHRHQPRGNLHHPSRPAGDRHQAEDRHAQGRPHHRGRMRLRPARRRAFGLRRGDDLVRRLDALRDLRPAQRQIRRPPRAHQYAALRRFPRPRHRRYPLRLREPARRDGGRTRARSLRRAAREFPDARRPSPTTI